MSKGMLIIHWLATLGLSNGYWFILTKNTAAIVPATIFIIFGTAAYCILLLVLLFDYIKKNLKENENAAS